MPQSIIVLFYANRKGSAVADILENMVILTINISTYVYSLIGNTLNEFYHIFKREHWKLILEPEALPETEAVKEISVR